MASSIRISYTSTLGEGSGIWRRAVGYLVIVAYWLLAPAHVMEQQHQPLNLLQLPARDSCRHSENAVLFPERELIRACFFGYIKYVHPKKTGNFLCISNILLHFHLLTPPNKQPNLNQTICEKSEEVFFNELSTYCFLVRAWKI